MKAYKIGCDPVDRNNLEYRANQIDSGCLAPHQGEGVLKDEFLRVLVEVLSDFRDEIRRS